MRLFVYGTLQPGCGTQMARWLEQRLLHASPATAPGLLLAVEDGGGWYPALVPGNGRITGTLCTLVPGCGDLARLDRYEGRHYRRMAMPTRTMDGRSIAQGYVWKAPLPPGALRISGGDFAAWRAQSGKRIYSSGERGT